MLSLIAQAVLGFRSSYALKLYEIGALRLHRRIPTWKCDITGLRATLGISPDVYKDFAQLRRKVLTTAKREIDQLAHFAVEWTETKKGRSVAEIEFRFVPKDAPAQLSTAEELERHSAGRAARRDNVVERIVDDLVPADQVQQLVAAATSSLRATESEGVERKSFPSGSLHWAGGERFLAIARESGGGWDIDMLADAYRAFMSERLMKLTGQKLEKSWRGFCESYVARRGRP